MDDERLLILTMLRDGKISAEEAEKLLGAIQSTSERAASSTGAQRSTPPRPPVAPQAPVPPQTYYSDSQIRRQAREVAREVRHQVRRAADEAKDLAREARRSGMEHARRVKHELRRANIIDDDDIRGIVDGISEGLREGMRGLREGLDIGMRESARGLREGMRGLSEGMRGVREGFAGTVSDSAGNPSESERHGHTPEPGRFNWTPGSDRCEACEEFERTVELPAGTALDLSATNGDCKVVLWDEPGAKIQGVKHAWGATDAEAKQRLAECDIVAEVEGSSLVIRERLPQGRVFGRPSCVDFVIYIPRAAALRVKAVNGDIECREAVGRLECRTINGDITLGNIGQADIGSTNGDITVDQASGSVAVADVNGDVTIGLLTVGGDSVTIRNVHGDIGCRLADDASATIEVSTRVGDVVTQRELKVEQRSGHRLVGRVGEGAGKIILTTINGDVTLK